MAHATACTPLLFDLIESNNTEHNYPNIVGNSLFLLVAASACLSQGTICSLGASTARKVVNARASTQTPLMTDAAKTWRSWFCFFWLRRVILGFSHFWLPSQESQIFLSHLLRELTYIGLGTKLHHTSIQIMFFFAWRFPRYGHVDDKIMRCT